MLPPRGVCDLVVSFSPRRALRTQSGSSTPNPAPASSGPVSLRNRNAPGVSSSTRAGAASRSASSSSPKSRAAEPSPASSSSTGSPPGAVPAPRPVPGPDIGGGDHQAGVVGGLQRELDPPGLGIRRVRLGEPEAGTYRARRYLRAVPPRVQFGGQLGDLVLVLRRQHLEAGIGRGQGQHVSFGHRKARRGAAPPRGQQRGGQPGPRGGVGQAIEGAAQQRSRRLPARRPARRGHRRGQIMGPLRVGAAEHGAPPGRVSLALVREHGQHPAARGQVRGEAGHRGQVGQRPARGRDVIGLAGTAEHGERGGGPEREHRHPPAGQRHPARRHPARHRLRPDEFRRGQRPAPGRGQLQGQLGVDGLAGRVAGMPRAARPAGRPARRPGTRTDADAAG